jgi:hypothetical protein
MILCHHNPGAPGSRPPVTLQQMFAVSQVETGRCDLAAFFLHRDMLRQCLPITSPTGATARATRGGRRWQHDQERSIPSLDSR